MNKRDLKKILRFGEAYASYKGKKPSQVSFREVLKVMLYDAETCLKLNL